MRKVCAVLLLTGVVFCGSAMATIEYSAGTGTMNSAIISFDFDGSQMFNFEYKWDGSATSWDALTAIDLAGALNMSATNWGTEEKPNYFIDEFSYPGATGYSYTTYAGWAMYEGDGTTWLQDGDGPSYNGLADGGYNAWVWTNYDMSWAPVREPGQMPTPEPATLVLLSLGGLLLRRKK